jgi:hypothetical protein
MRMGNHIISIRLALAVGLLIASLSSFGIVHPAMAQPAALSTAQADALSAYDHALSDFKSILAERRRQIDAHQELPNLPGQALYLARIGMMSTYKDLTDALPSKIGRPNKFKIPPQYFDADNEPLVDEYRALFDIMEAPPAYAQTSPTPFKDVADLGTVSASDYSSPRPAAHRTPAMHAPTATRAVSRRRRPKTETAGENGKPSSRPSQPSIGN